MRQMERSDRAATLAEVWGDTVDVRDLVKAIGIGLTVSLACFWAADQALRAWVATPELARAYAMLAGLAGCVLAGLICARLFKPKRRVIDGDSDGDAALERSRREVLDNLAQQHGGLGSTDDLSAATLAEMRELGIDVLFSARKP